MCKGVIMNDGDLGYVTVESTYLIPTSPSWTYVRMKESDGSHGRTSLTLS